MSKRIIYPSSDGGVCIIVPSNEALAKHTIDEIAKKDVPHGTQYMIVNADEIPSDRTFRNAWSIDITVPDGVGGESSEFETKEVQQ